MLNINSFPGSKWLKIDFHVHTPASNDYQDLSITPELWLKKAMEKNLDCVVVSDYNSGKWIDKLKIEQKKLKSEKPIWYKDIVIFPAVEITIAEKERTHLLAIFDPEKSTDEITAFLGSCEIKSNFGDCDKLASPKSILETIEIIKDNDGVAIAAHVDKPKGLFYGNNT